MGGQWAGRVPRLRLRCEPVCRCYSRGHMRMVSAASRLPLPANRAMRETTLLIAEYRHLIQTWHHEWPDALVCGVALILRRIRRETPGKPWILLAAQGTDVVPAAHTGNASSQSEDLRRKLQLVTV